MVMMHHFLVSVGFFVGPNFVSLYIPDSKGDPEAIEHQRQQICHVGDDEKAANRSRWAVDLNQVSALGNEVLYLDFSVRFLVDLTVVLSFQFGFKSDESMSDKLIDLDTPFRDLALMQVLLALMYILPVISQWEMSGEDIHCDVRCI